MFGRGRRRLTIFYSSIMFIFMAVLILLTHRTMEWSIVSEQAHELLDMTNSIVEGQEYLNQHPEIILDDATIYKSSQDRLFFYVFDDAGGLIKFSRASLPIEPFVLEIISTWNGREGDVTLYGKENEGDHAVKIMMTAQQVHTGSGSIQTVYVGKDVTVTYNGIQKSIYALAVLGFISLLFSTAIGHFISGRALEPLQEAYEKQRQFAADASHELRTPLAVVLASAELLDNDPSIQSPFLKQIIEDVRDEVRKMTKLVSDLLVVVRSDNQALNLKLSKFDLSKLLQQTIRVMQPLAEKKEILLSGLNLEEKHEIQADEQKIKQLIIIFVDNALKYTASGSIELGFLPTEKGFVRFFVQDTGIGISEENQKKIFDRFYRVDKARSREMGGNGLGLAIAMEIVSLHKGKILVESELGKGTKFIIELRVKLKSRIG